YPWIARKMGREGRVLLRLTIDETGRLLDVVVVEKAGFGFDREAVKAVRLSTFRPAVRNGMPVKSEALLYVKFEFE
ncbi:MAG TPA: energy transducer TonB, partial [Nitrospirae bacterium]|nr:energy transducer TonB [Nitrospirota bacterium]